MNKQNLIIEACEYYDYIYSFIKSRANYNEILASDVCQDTYKKVIKTIKENKYKENNLKAWVTVIARNTLIDYQRKESKIKYNSNTLIDYIPSEEDNIDTLINKQEQIKEIQKYIKLLPKKQQQIIDLVIFKNYKYIEVANLTGISIGTLLSRMSYAIKNLKKLMKNK